MERSNSRERETRGARIAYALSSETRRDVQVRDPLVLFEGMVRELDDENATDHFENLQSTNWNSVRWKPPPCPNEHEIGWRRGARRFAMF